jgi:TrmH family RNA methyltransferase
MRPSDCDVVLVRPLRPENVGAACRAMKNMGLQSLRLVSPPRGVHGEDSRSQAWRAWDIFEGAQESANLAEAVASSTLVVGTSGKAEAAWSPRRLALEGGARAGGGRVALVFGPESTGLTREELALCHLVVRIPTDPGQPSLNLAQAVLIVAYEIFLSASTVEQEAPPHPRPEAGEVEAALGALGDGLSGIGYLSPQSGGTILSELRRLLVRAEATSRELTLLRGMGRQILWAAREIARAREGKR